MRSLFLAMSLLALPAVLGAGCAASTTGVSAQNPRGPVEVTLSTSADTAKLTLGDAKYRIELRKITDSRCPANAKCIWQGELAAELSVDRERAGARDSLLFTLGQETMPSLAGLGASFELLEISETTVKFRVALGDDPR